MAPNTLGGPNDDGFVHLVVRQLVPYFLDLVEPLRALQGHLVHTTSLLARCGLIVPVARD